MPPEAQLSDFYHPSGAQNNSELLFVAVGTNIVTCALYKYLKQMTDEYKLKHISNISQAYYQSDRLWTSNKAVKELHKITSVSKKDNKSWLAKQNLWQVHVPPPKEMHHPY